MTKRPPMSAPSSKLAKRKRSRAPWLALSLLLACASGVGVALGGGGDKTPHTELSLRLAQIWPQGLDEAPQAQPSLRLGGWPAQLIGQPEGTKLKSVTTPEAMPVLPAIASVIDDCGVGEVHT